MFSQALSEPHIRRQTQPDGSYNIKYYKYDMYLHRDDGPAMETFTPDDQLRCSYWYIDGEAHREDGPAIIEYVNGTKVYECYVINGDAHREDGPAVLYYDQVYGKLEDVEYYKHGRQLPTSAFQHLEQGTPEFEFTFGML